jgi:hypothetical protein
MKTVLFIFSMLFTTATFCQDKVIIDDKNAAMRTVGSFSSIKVSGAIDLYLTQGGTETVVVSAENAKVRENIKTEVSNGVLNIYYNDRSLWNSGDKKLKAYVSFKSINSLELSGASSCKVTGSIKESDLDIRLSGASNMTSAVNIGHLNLELSGASDIKLNGRVTEAKMEASGASNVKGYDLVVDECKAKGSGASDIHVTVNKQLAAEVSGASSFRYKGNPNVTQSRSTGASSINKQD